MTLAAGVKFCADCGADLEGRHPNAERCLACADARKYNHDKKYNDAASFREYRGARGKYKKK